MYNKYYSRMRDNRPFYKKIYENIVNAIIAFKARLFSRKKILIISEKKIINLHLGAKSQALCLACITILMVWVSFTSGKYFAYEQILSEKNQKIRDQFASHQDILSQARILYGNLNKLNKYFADSHNIVMEEEVDDLDLRQVDPIYFNGSAESSASHAVQEISVLRSKSDKALYKLFNKIDDRIEHLENIIQLTGVNAKIINFKKINKKPEDVMKNNSGIGGPYEPIEEQAFNYVEFDHHIDHLYNLENLISKMPLSYPVEHRNITSGFGKRIDPFRKKLAIHKGIDFAGPPGSKVLSSAPGKVTVARNNGAYGLYVQIDHGNGFQTRYGHLKKILVKHGQNVKKGEVIGIEGSTGRSTAPHLHYEVRYNNQPYDPKKFLKAGEYEYVS